MGLGNKLIIYFQLLILISYICHSYKKKSPEMSPLKARHYLKKYIAHNYIDFKKNQHIKALYLYYVVNPISLVKRN